MIKSVKIQNFQSHEDTTINFAPGTTAIIGTSDSGKSAVIRALNWIRTNRPLGTSFINRTANSPCRVELTLDKDGQEVVIVRQKTSKDTGFYEINGERFKALRSDVPEPVLEALSLSDLNVQRQLDQHFLVLDSPGRVAQVVNSITKIEDADKVLAEIIRRIRENHSIIKQAEGTKIQTEDQLKAPVFELLPDFERMCDDLEVYSNTLAQNAGDIEVLKRLVCDMLAADQALSAVDEDLQRKQPVDELAQIAAARFVEAERLLRESKILSELHQSLSRCTAEFALVDRQYQLEVKKEECLRTAPDLASLIKVTTEHKNNLAVVVEKLQWDEKGIASTDASINRIGMVVDLLGLVPEIAAAYRKSLDARSMLSKMMCEINQVERELAEVDSKYLEVQATQREILQTIRICPVCESTLDEKSRDLVRKNLT